MPEETHVLDLLPAYALGSLDADEARYVEEHLLSCWICRGESSTFQDVAEQLSFAAPAEVPSTDLKERLLDRVQAVRLSRASRLRQRAARGLSVFCPSGGWQ